MKYAIVESGGKQYKAVEGATIEVDRLPAQAGENVKLEQVLLLVDGESITVGKPVVSTTPVWAKVLEHFKGEKVTIFNYSPKKRIRVKTGHRQNYTRLLVQQIGGEKPAVKEVEPKAKKEKKVAATKPAATEEKVKKTAPKASIEKKAVSKTPAAKKTTGTAAKKSGTK